MTDLIRKSDAIRVMLAYASSYSAKEAETAIAALPAVTVGVRNLVWHKSDIWQREKAGEYSVQNEKERTGADVWSAWKDGAFVGDFTTIDAAKAAAQADYEARIVSALEPVAAPRRASKPLPADGFATSDAEGQWCRDVDAGVYDDPAAIREAADVVEREIEQAKQLMPMVVPILRSVHRAILALIPTKGSADDRA